MADLDETVAAVVNAASWDARVGLLRRVPEEFGTGQHQAVFAAVARQVYVPTLAPDFAYVHRADDYELAPLEAAYQRAYELTDLDRAIECARRISGQVHDLVAGDVYGWVNGSWRDPAVVG